MSMKGKEVHPIEACKISERDFDLMSEYIRRRYTVKKICADYSLSRTFVRNTALRSIRKVKRLHDYLNKIMDFREVADSKPPEQPVVNRDYVINAIRATCNCSQGGYCTRCTKLLNLLLADDLRPAFDYIRKLQSLHFTVISWISHSPQTSIGEALGDYYRNELAGGFLTKEQFEHFLRNAFDYAAAQHPPAVTNPPTSPVPPAAESFDGSRDTGGAGIANSGECGSVDLASPATTRPTTQKPSERTRTACGESRALA